MMSDIEISNKSNMKTIDKIAKKIKLSCNDIEMYGKYKAKISKEAIIKLENKKQGKLILVTAINPTPAGEGKTTVSIGLSMGLNKIGKNSIVCLRQPSLRTSIWNKRWCNRRRLLTSSSYGRYKS